MPQQAPLETFAAGRRFAFLANTLDIQRAAARAGAGIAALPDFMGDHDPGLTRVTSGPPLLVNDICMVVHSELVRAAPMRAVVAAVREVFRT